MTAYTKSRSKTKASVEMIREELVQMLWSIYRYPRMWQVAHQVPYLERLVRK